MIIDDLFVKYPNLKPETDKEIIEIKKSFMAFLGIHLEERMEVSDHEPRILIYRMHTFTY